MPEDTLTPDDRKHWLGQVVSALASLQAEGSTMTYLELAEHIGMAGPHRIHRLTGLLEQAMVHDVAMGRTPRAALVISRAREGMPAPGFFSKARTLGIMKELDPRSCHQHLLAELARERRGHKRSES